MHYYFFLYAQFHIPLYAGNKYCAEICIQRSEKQKNRHFWTEHDKTHGQ